jgi:predicted ester cyclase
MPPVPRNESKPRRGPPGRDPVATVRAYIDRINAHDPEGLSKLAVARARFVDASGGEFVLSRKAWASYFALFPDYRIRAERFVSTGRAVAVFGVASGSFRGRGRRASGAAWRFPAAWYAVVRAGKVAEWRVYGDIERMLESAGLGRR